MAEWNDKLASYVRANFKNVAAAARHYGIPPPTFGDYVSGRITNLARISPKRRAILYEATGMKELNPEGYERTLGTPEKPAAERPARKALERYREHGMEGADIAVDLFYAFAENLGELSRNPQAIEFVAGAINPKDAGLVISYLNALFAPEGTTTTYVFGQPLVLRGRRK